MNKSIYRKPISTTYVGNQVIRAKNSLFTLAFPDNSVIKFLFICKYPVNYRFYDKFLLPFFSFNSNEEAINGKYFRQIYQCEAYSIRLTNAHDETEEKSFVSTCLWLLSAWLTCSVRWPMERAKLSECGGFCQTFFSFTCFTNAMLPYGCCWFLFSASQLRVLCECSSSLTKHTLTLLSSTHQQSKTKSLLFYHGGLHLLVPPCFDVNN